MEELKVGDRVKLINKGHIWFGNEYIIADIIEGIAAYVVDDRGDEHHSFLIEHLQVVSKEPTKQASADTLQFSDPMLDWDGITWPPPVGTRCLARNPYTLDGHHERATVIHHSRKGAIVVEHDHGDIAILTAPGEFRPIHSAEARAVDALSDVLKQYGIIPDDSVGAVVSKAIYDSIRDGNIPSVKLEGEA